MRRSRARQVVRGAPGFGLVEALVGVVIALITVIGVHRVVIASESTRRGAQSDADAQQTAQFALARMTFDLANAGAGIATAARALSSCPVTADFTAMTRPIAVVITDGGAVDTPDSVVVRYAVAGAMALPARFAAPAPSGGSFVLRAPLGIAPDDQLIASDRRGRCTRATVTGVRVLGSGTVDVQHDIVAVDMPADAIAVNLGTVSRVVATRYDVAGGSLRTTDLAGGDAPNPLISNVVNLKVQYGIDTDGDGALDTWVAATAAGGSGDWSSDSVLRAPAGTLARIKALRVGIIVRGEQFDRAATGALNWVLFDCEAADKRSCPGRIAGSIPGAARGGWHYRTYETVVPLRNVMWQRP